MVLIEVEHKVSAVEDEHELLEGHITLMKDTKRHKV